MTHSNRKLASRRSVATVALTAFFALTAAKGGCGGTVIVPEPVGRPACEAGFHRETQCSSTSVSVGSGCGAYYDESGHPVPVDCVAPALSDSEECSEVCVPDACPHGTVLQEICVGGSSATTSGGGDEDESTRHLEPNECFFECVPVNPCGIGYHVEQIREGDRDRGYVCPPNTACALPEPAFFESCVPDTRCPPGTHEELVCWEYDCGEGEDCGGGGCEPECVPDHDCGDHEPGLHHEAVPPSAQ
jgi:hypothetical protein